MILAPPAADGGERRTYVTLTFLKDALHLSQGLLHVFPKCLLGVTVCLVYILRKKMAFNLDVSLFFIMTINFNKRV